MIDANNIPPFPRQHHWLALQKHCHYPGIPVLYSSKSPAVMSPKQLRSVKYHESFALAAAAGL